MHNQRHCKYTPKSGLYRRIMRLNSSRGSRDGAVVRALASHQCGPGSIPGLGVICGLSLLLVLVLAPRGFSPGTPVFPSPQKTTFPNSNSIWNPRATGLSVVRLLSVTLVKQSWFIYYFYFIKSNREVTGEAAIRDSRKIWTCGMNVRMEHKNKTYSRSKS